MAKATSAWTKPGDWALESEEYESSADYPSLAIAATACKSLKKKKPQALSLAEFVGGRTVSHGEAARSRLSGGLTPDELLLLPTGPRERSAKEMESSSRGFGHPACGNGEARRMDGSACRDSRNEARRNYNLNRDSAPSRSDEVNDWLAKKRLGESPAKKERGGKLFDSQSRSDEVDSWISKRVSLPNNLVPNRGESSEGRADSDIWKKKKEEAIRTDPDRWGKTEEGANSSCAGRPKLALLPRSVPLVNGNTNCNNEVNLQVYSKGSNPFGHARPREEVLAEKGLNWKTIDEKFNSVKIIEVSEDRSGRSWRKECFSGSH